MHTTLKKLILAIIPLLVLSCIRENNDDCGIYLEFIFDYNMKFADTFDKEVETVDVYIFDENGRYLFHKHAVCAADLVGGKRMYLDNGFSAGKTYKLITVGGLCDSFRFTDLDDKDLVKKRTTLEQVKLALNRQSNEVSHEFPHVWLGGPVQINFRADLSVWPVHLVRNTNNFHIVLHSRDADIARQDALPYLSEIITPEGAAYGYDNGPLIREAVTYLPHYSVPGEEGVLLSARLNTMRLFADDPDGYRLVIRDTETRDVVCSYDLMELLAKTKPSRPDGTPIPLQEYLDRESQWDVVITCRDGEGFVALRITINGWIIWENDIEV